MSDNLQKRPSKGILKNSSSFDKHEAPQKKQKGKATQWDEMNIIATLHPADKDYGHIKIREPKTPYNWDIGEGNEPELDAKELAELIAKSKDTPAKALQGSSSEEEDEEEEDESESPEERAKRKLFESKRRAHYNEYHAIKLARKLIEAAEDEEEGGDESQPKQQGAPRTPSPSPQPPPPPPRQGRGPSPSRGQEGYKKAK